MAEAGCKVCKILLDRAADAISAHASAVARLEQSVSANPESNLSELESVVDATRLMRETAVIHYELHRSDHGSKTRTAGSGAAE
jgi:hypothetical protein